MPRRKLLAGALPKMLSPGEVAEIFGVDPKTVSRWAAAGKIDSIRTPGGHRRFEEEKVKAFLASPEAKEEETE